LNRYSFLLEPPRIGRGAPVPETHGRKGGDERQHVFQRGPGGMKNSGVPPGFSFGQPHSSLAALKIWGRGAEESNRARGLKRSGVVTFFP
jgi:hypothetical protein